MNSQSGGKSSSKNKTESVPCVAESLPRRWLRQITTTTRGIFGRFCAGPATRRMAGLSTGPKDQESIPITLKNLLDDFFGIGPWTTRRIRSTRHINQKTARLLARRRRARRPHKHEGDDR